LNSDDETMGPAGGAFLHPIRLIQREHPRVLQGTEAVRPVEEVIVDEIQVAAGAGHGVQTEGYVHTVGAVAEREARGCGGEERTRSISHEQGVSRKGTHTISCMIAQGGGFFKGKVRVSGNLLSRMLKIARRIIE
jgi:hypothetical protein